MLVLTNFTQGRHINYTTFYYLCEQRNNYMSVHQNIYKQKDTILSKLTTTFSIFKKDEAF